MQIVWKRYTNKDICTDFQRYMQRAWKSYAELERDNKKYSASMQKYSASIFNLKHSTAVPGTYLSGEWDTAWYSLFSSHRTITIALFYLSTI